MKLTIQHEGVSRGIRGQFSIFLDKSALLRLQCEINKAVDRGFICGRIHIDEYDKSNKGYDVIKREKIVANNVPLEWNSQRTHPDYDTGFDGDGSWNPVR